MSKILRECAENSPEAREILLQKANAHDKKLPTMLNKESYLKLLEQVEDVLTKVEEELSKHSDSMYRTKNILISDIYSVCLVFDYFCYRFAVVVMHRQIYCGRYRINYTS